MLQGAIDSDVMKDFIQWSSFDAQLRNKKRTAELIELLERILFLRRKLKSHKETRKDD